jgi:hypothetical protein
VHHTALVHHLEATSGHIISVISSAAQGWTTPYDFSVADLRAAADVVAAAAAGSNASGPDWQQLLGLLQVIYGGRVSSKQDAKVNRGANLQIVRFCLANLAVYRHAVAQHDMADPTSTDMQ